MHIMKKLTYILSFFLLLTAASCKKYPYDGEGRLITTRSESFVTFFDLLGPDNRSVLVGAASIDTAAHTVTAKAKFGTNLKHVKPYSSLITDALMEPAMGQWVDFSQPREYTVISGDRKVKNTYTFTVTLEDE